MTSNPLLDVILKSDTTWEEFVDWYEDDSNSKVGSFKIFIHSLLFNAMFPY